MADEEILGKAYDSRLMKRLLQYAVPHAGKLIAALLLLALITLGDLAGPYLMKVIIDDHLDPSNSPYVAIPIEEVENYQGQGIDGMAFIRKSEEHSGLQEYYLLSQGGSFYFAPFKVTGAYTIKENTLTVNGQSYDVIYVPKAEAKVIRSSDYNSVMKLSAVYLVLMVGLGLLTYVQGYILTWGGQAIIYAIRQEIFEHLQHLDLAYFDKNYVGRIVTRATNDVENLNEMYTDILVNTIKDVLTLIGIVVIMLRLDWKLSLITFTVVPLMIAGTIVFRKKVREAYRKVRRYLSELNGFLAESISGMRIVQIFNQEKRKYKEFLKIDKDYETSSLGEITVYAVFRPFMDLLYYVALVLILLYGGGQVLQGRVQFGLLIAFISYAQRFFGPINALTEKFNIMQSAMASAERIFQLLDTKPTIVQPKDPKTPTEVKGGIEFKNVWFAYNGDEYVLKDISFVANPGETVAFVGHTGAGKTSIINLVNRFYDIQKGQILIDGLEIREWDLTELRKRIGIVLQDVFLFSGDIKSNIRLNNEDISQKDILEACRAVGADKFIMKLPRGYDEKVTERGSTLSQGQRQLLAFARALAFDPDILILDEATSNIDTETELLIQEALKRVTKDRTTLVIAHRLSTIQHADKIIVLHKGEVAEMGTHQELLARGGLYYKLYQLQYMSQRNLA